MLFPCLFNPYGGKPDIWAGKKPVHQWSPQKQSKKTPECHICEQVALSRFLQLLNTNFDFIYFKIAFNAKMNRWSDFYNQES